MVRTKNPEPTSTYTDSTRETNSSQPNFILLGPPQPICDVKPLKSRPAKMKHVPSGNPRISTRVKWQNAAKNNVGTNPDSPIDLEKGKNAHVQGTEQPAVAMKVATSSKVEKAPIEKVPSKNVAKKVVEQGEKSEAALPSCGKQLKGVKKRKQPDMSNWSKKVIVSGIVYTLEEIEKCGWHITPLLTQQKWDKFISLDDLIYRERVREFMQMPKYELEPHQITSWIGDREFAITPSSIGRDLKIPNQGTEMLAENWYNLIGISIQELKATLLKDHSLPISAPNLKPLVRILHHISSHTLLPREGSFEKVALSDSMILYHLIEQKPLNIPFLIIHHMINDINADKLTNSLPYGKALTRIFNPYLIKMSVAEGSIDFKPFTSKNIKLMGLGVSTRDEQDDGKKKKKKQKLNILLVLLQRMKMMRLLLKH